MCCSAAEFFAHRSGEGIALAENAEMLKTYDTAVETPTLQQLSVGILRKAEEDEK